MTTATTTAITITYRPENLIFGTDPATLDFPATIDRYETCVRCELDNYDITFNRQPGEGLGEWYYAIVGEELDDDEIRSKTAAVFERGEFWVLPDDAEAETRETETTMTI